MKRKRKERKKKKEKEKKKEKREKKKKEKKKDQKNYDFRNEVLLCFVLNGPQVDFRKTPRLFCFLFFLDLLVG